jgi:hypothetical protein
MFTPPQAGKLSRQSRSEVDVMKWIFLLLLLIPTLAFGQSYNASSYTAGSFNSAGCGGTGGVCFADLASFSVQNNGTITYCKDCNQLPVCGSGGHGAIAMKQNGVWSCGGLPSSTTGPGVCDGAGNCSVTTLTSSGATNASSLLVSGPTTINVNGEVNAATYTSAGDLGQMVNAANAALPTESYSGHNYHAGTIYIPGNSTGAGGYKIWTFTHTMVIDPGVRLKCDPSVVLNYTGAASTDAINQQSPTFDNTMELQGGVADCQIHLNNTGQVGIHIGDVLGQHYLHNYIYSNNLAGTVGILTETRHYFNEHNIFDGNHLDGLAHGLQFKVTCSIGTGNCSNSFEYNFITNTYCQVGTQPSSNCLEILGGGDMLHSTVNLNGNVNSSGGALIYTDSASKYYGNMDQLSMESGSGGFLTNQAAQAGIQTYGTVIASNGCAQNGTPIVCDNVGPIAYHTFNIPGSYQPFSFSGIIEAWIYGAGGGGNTYGGGQGGYIHCLFTGPGNVTYTVNVGTGGAAGGGNGTASAVLVNGGAQSCTAGPGLGGSASAAGAGGGSTANAGPPLQQFNGAAGSGGSGGSNGVPGYCPCGGNANMKGGDGLVAVLVH